MGVGGISCVEWVRLCHELGPWFARISDVTDTLRGLTVVDHVLLLFLFFPPVSRTLSVKVPDGTVRTMCES